MKTQIYFLNFTSVFFDEILNLFDQWKNEYIYKTSKTKNEKHVNNQSYYIYHNRQNYHHQRSPTLSRHEVFFSGHYETGRALSHSRDMH